jgi:hypothetical protein
VPGNKVDEDCNSTADDAPLDCDAVVTDVADADPLNGARAMGLCQMATAGDKKWGVLEAVSWRMARQDERLGHGMLPCSGP